MAARPRAMPAGAFPWREDGRCGNATVAPDGSRPAICNPWQPDGLDVLPRHGAVRAERHTWLRRAQAAAAVAARRHVRPRHPRDRRFAPVDLQPARPVQQHCCSDQGCDAAARRTTAAAATACSTARCARASTTPRRARTRTRARATLAPSSSTPTTPLTRRTTPTTSRSTSARRSSRRTASRSATTWASSTRSRTWGRTGGRSSTRGRR